jgi:hypothetical protein
VVALATKQKVAMTTASKGSNEEEEAEGEIQSLKHLAVK